ncbi:10405_t:CDS:2, partial [Funneliformis mosseae]
DQVLPKEPLAIGSDFYQESRPLDGIDRFLHGSNGIGIIPSSSWIKRDRNYTKYHDHLMESIVSQPLDGIDGFLLRTIRDWNITKDHDHLMGSKGFFHWLRSPAATTKNHDHLMGSIGSRPLDGIDMDNTGLEFYQGSRPSINFPWATIYCDFYQESRPLDGIDRFLPRITRDWTSIKDHDHLMGSM